MGRGQRGGGKGERGGDGEGEKQGQEEGRFHRWIGLVNSCKPGTTEAIAFTDSYKHMKCLCGMRLQSFLTNGYFVYPCNAGYPS